MLGQKFGHLSVFEFAGLDERHRALWWTQCICGNRQVKQSYHLVRGAVTSCGCERNASKRKGSETTKHISYKTHRKRALEKKLMPLDRPDWERLVLSPCHYCGGFDKRGYRTDLKMSDRVFETMILELNGIDRVDSSKGYEIDNCVPCCYACNRGKGTMSREGFLAHVRKIYQKHNSDN